jgi:eukaryotic-like serine/threonine-protein kinase
VGSPAAKSAAPKRLTGSKVGKYTLDDLLGQGGFGDVYVGKQKTGPNVAVKLLDAAHARDEDAIVRFKREGETAKRLQHPNIVRVLDVGSSRQRHYLVMELVRGGSFDRLLRNAAPPDKVLSVLTDTARALAYAHAQGVVHRDVKPSNILITRSGKAKVADFGLARAVDQSSLTTEGRMIGTASYMSPEQVKGDRATAASDVYAMGVVIYHSITGELPFTSDTQLGFLYQHAEVDPPAPRVRAPYPTSLGQLALDCLAKKPKDRPTMEAVADRLAATSLVAPRTWRLIALVVLLIAAAALALAYFRIL